MVSTLSALVDAFASLREMPWSQAIHAELLFSNGRDHLVSW